MGENSGDEKSLKWSSIIATIATTILAITSLVTVYITLTAWRDERESARPYLTMKESPIVSLDDELTFELKFYNVGFDPATNLNSKTVVFDQGLSSPPVHHDDVDLVNEIAKDTSSSLMMSIDKKDINPRQSNIPPSFIIINLQYDDPLLKKSFSQTIYLKWNGVVNKKLQPITHIRAEDKAKVEDYLNRHKISFKRRKDDT